MFGLLTVAVVQLLLSQAAPLRQAFGTGTPMAVQAKRQAAFTAPIVRLADGRNIELHFGTPSPSPPGADLLTAGVYYGVTYALAPARAYVGEDRTVINDGVTLRAADHVAPDRWLRDHGVAAVLTFPLDAQGLRRPSARLVR